MNKIALTLMVLLLSACSTTNTSYIPICAPVVKYSNAEQDQAAAELKNCNCPEIKEILKDGHVLRNANKECTKK